MTTCTVWFDPDIEEDEYNKVWCIQTDSEYGFWIDEDSTVEDIGIYLADPVDGGLDPIDHYSELEEEGNFDSIEEALDYIRMMRLLA